MFVRRMRVRRVGSGGGRHRWIGSGGCCDATSACPVMCQRPPTTLHRIAGCVTHSDAGLHTQNLTTCTATRTGCTTVRF